MPELDSAVTPRRRERRFSAVPDDEQITADVRAALEDDDRLAHPREIAVACRDGSVELRGTVSTPRRRSIAQEIAKSVRGVRAVEVELHVDLRDRWLDNEVRGVALQALIADDRVPIDRVDVSVSDGWLTLKGEVEDQSASDAAFAAVRELPGVGGITNEIKVITAGIDR